MLLIIKCVQGLSVSQLMEVYSESNKIQGFARWPEEPEMRRVQLAEMDFYGYLRDCFFPVPGAVCAVWVADGRYVSALRLEPFRDGMLLEALETAPDQRRKGYASLLIRQVQSWIAAQGYGKLYSHVHKENSASMGVHKACGFRLIANHAAFIDGSVSQHSCTMCWEKNISTHP